MKSVFYCGLLAALSGMLLTRCGVSPVGQAGGDDFPNMIADAGTAIAENLDQHWENPASADVDPSTLVQPELPSLDPGAGGIGKRSLLAKSKAADSVWYDIDLISGTIILYSRSNMVDAVKFDTLIFKVSGTDTMIVSYTGAIVGKAAQVITDRYRYTDYDGDSLLFSTTADHQQVLVELTHEGVLERVESGRYVVDAGPDNDFATEPDNKIVLADALVTLQGDSVSAVEIRDGDGDGYAVDYGNGDDSCLVDLYSVFFAATALSPLKRSATTATMVVFPADSQSNYAISYQVENTYASRTVNWTIVTTDGGEVFYPGDTVNVFRITTGANDSLDTDTMKILALLGDNPRDTLDDALLGIYLHVKFLRGNNLEVQFDYTAETPILAGDTPHDGTVFFKSTYNDDSWIEVDATLNESDITADVTTSGNKHYKVTWDYEGNVVSVEDVD